MKPGQRYYKCNAHNHNLQLGETAVECPNNVSVLNSRDITTTYHCRTKRTVFLHRAKYVPPCLVFLNKNEQYNNSTHNNSSNKIRTAQKLKLASRFR